MAETTSVLIDGSPLTGTSIIVYRADRTTSTISGTDISFSVVGGTLVVSSGSTAVYAFSPSQWLTVNSAPV